MEKKYEEKLNEMKRRFSKMDDLIVREVDLGGKMIAIIYISNFCSKDMISRQILFPLREALNAAGEVEKTESIMLNYYPKVNSKYENNDLLLKWSRLIKIKDIVSKKLEEARSNRLIGLSLEAKVNLFAEGEEYEFLKDKLDLLKDLFIVSRCNFK